jgi:signal transduction histidine kinase/tetratricopeptide (TPR) repeat protein
MAVWRCCLFCLLSLLPLLAAAESHPRALAEESLSLYDKDLDRAYRIAVSSLHLAHQQRNKIGEAWALLALGISYRQKGLFDSAFIILKTSAQIFHANQLLKESSWALIEAAGARSQYSYFSEAHDILQSAMATLRRVAPLSTQMAEAHRELGLNYLRWQQMRQSLPHLDTARRIYEQLHDNYGLARTLNNIGLCYRNMGELEIALQSYLASLGAFERVKYPTRSMTAVLVNIANLNRQLGDTTAQAVDSLYARAYRIAIQLRDTLQMIGMAYSRNEFLLEGGRYDEAAFHLKEALHLSRLAHMYIEEAHLTMQQGKLLGKQRQMDAAIEVLQKAVLLYEKAGNAKQAINPLDEMAHLFFLQKNYEQAIRTALKAMEIKQNNADLRFVLPRIRDILSKSYFYSAQYDQSRVVAMELLEEGQQSNRKTTSLGAYKLLYMLDSVKGDTRSEIAWLKKYYILKDSIMNGEKANAMKAAQASYSLKQARNENRLQAIELAQRNTYLWAAGIVIALAVILLGVLVHQASQRRATNLMLLQKNSEITQQNEQLATRNKELAALNNEKTNLIRIITHDLRTPLGNISSLSQIALYDTSPNREVIEMIGQVATDALDTVGQLLSWQSISRGELSLSKEALDISNLLHVLADRFATEAARKQITIHNIPSAAEQSATAVGDKNFTRNILENLISNALKFSPKGKNIYLTTQLRGSMLAIQVRDEGPGIKPEEVSRLFGQFQQLSARPTAGEPSSGLGLYIARRYALAMSGDLVYEGQPGEGATFVLLLPTA